MSKEGKKHINACHLLYEETGVSAVFDYANRKNITDWRNCRRCETGVPVADDTCLVCGNNVAAEPHITEQTDEDIVPMTFSNDTAAPQKLIFTAVKRNDPDYPGIDIMVNGQTVATVECSDNKIRTLAFEEGIEEFTTETIFKDLSS